MSGQNVMFIEHGAAGAKSYKVVPMSDYYEGNGIASAAKKLTVTDIWKAAPTITNVRQAADDVVEITWEAPNNLQDEFVIFDTVGKTKTEVDFELNTPRAVSYEYTATVRDVAPGTHKYTVQAASYNDAGERVLGTASAAQSLTMVDVKWNTAPWITSIDQNVVNKATIYWEHVTDVESYVVYQKTGTAFEQIGETSDKYFDVSFDKTGEYTFAVRPQQTNEYGQVESGTMSKAAAAELFASADAKVTGFTAHQSGFTAELDWDWDDLATYYVAEMISTENGVLGSINADGSCCEFDAPKGTYGFRVRPVFYDGEKNVEGPNSKTIWLEFGEKVEITSAAFDPTKDGVVLKWTTSTANSVSGYRIYRYDDEEGEYVILASGSFANKTYTDTAVEIGETYKYMVAAFRATGEDVPSDEVTVKVEMPMPSAPQNLKAKHYGEMVKLTWDGVPEESTYPVYYHIYRMDDDKTLLAETGVGEHEYSVEADATNPVTYFVEPRMKLGDYNIGGPRSEMITVYPNPTSTVTAGFNAERGTIDIEWSAVENAKQYVLQKSVNGGEWTDIGVVGDFFWMDMDVELGKTYAYRILTTFETGASCSEATSVQLKRLGAVTGLEASYDNAYVSLSWNELENVSGYEIERICGGEVTTITVSDAAYTDEVDLGAAYTYRVRGLMGDKAGAWSAALTIEVGNAPVITSAEYSHKLGGVELTWEAYSAPGSYVLSGYAVYRQAEGEVGPSFYEAFDAGVTTFIDSNVEAGKTYSYKVAVALKANAADETPIGQIISENTVEVKPEALPTVGVARTWYFNENTEIYLNLPENASEEFTYIVKENGTTIASELVEDEGEWKLVFNAPDLNDHTYTVHVAVVTNAGSTIAGEGTEVTIDRGELWKLKNITDDEDGVHLYWDVREGSMPKHLFVMSVDVTDPKNHQYRDELAPADAASGVYTDNVGNIALSGKTLDYWLEAVYENGLLSSEGMSDIEEKLPYKVSSTLFMYEVDGKNATIYGYKGKSAKDLTIPAKVDGFTVTKIGRLDEEGNGVPFATPNAQDGLTGTLTIENGIVEILEFAFHRTAITGELVIPASVKTIGMQAFGSTTISGELVIPATVTKVWNGAFNNCKYLTDVVIEGANTVFEAGVFRSCYNGRESFGLESITLPEGMTTIPGLFAENNPFLTSVNIPSTVKTIDFAAFSNCTALTGTLKIPAGVTTLGAGAFGNTGYTVAEIYNKALTEAAIADAFGKKWEGAADDVVACDVNLTKICGYLGSGAYNYATSMGIEFEGIGLTDNGEKFDIAEDGTAVFLGFDAAVSGAVTIPATVDGLDVTVIGKDAFKGNTAITSVTVPDGVTEIGESAFEGCTKLASANLPDSVEIIGVRAFANCTSLSSMQ